MKKIAYQTPEWEVIEIKINNALLSTSMNTDDSTTTGPVEDGSDLPDLGL